MSAILEELQEALELLQNFINTPQNIDEIQKASDIMIAAIKSGNKIISCGNGGSMSDAMHFAEELTGKFRHSRASIPAIAISDPAYISCTANDYGYDFIFSRFVEGIANEGDVLLGISTSGNSSNVINAVEAACAKGVKTVVLTGKDGGELSHLTDVEIRIPHMGYADRIQEMHIKVIHILIMLIEQGVKE